MAPKRMCPEALAAGSRHIATVDERMAPVIEALGACRLPKRRSRYAALVRTIVGQQVSTSAARAVYARLTEAAGGRVTPEHVGALDAGALRDAGLSRQKARYVGDLTEHVLSGSLPLGTLHRLDDEAVVEALTRVKGLGRWSAEMFLMFVLDRPDVLSTGDLGLQKGFQRVYGMRRLPKPDRMHRIAGKWRPYRTIGCFYLWRCLDAP